MAKMSDYVGEDFGRNVASVLGSVKAEAKKVQIEYDFFCEKMLPHFASGEEDPEFNTNYIGFVGGVDVTANVVRDGEVVLTIPPVLAIPELSRERGVNSTQVIEDYGRMGEINPTAAIEMLRENLASSYKAQTVDEFYHELLPWDRILKENGYPGYDLSGIAELIEDTEKEIVTDNNTAKEELPKFDDDFGDWG